MEKTKTHTTPGEVGLVDWLKQAAPRHSLVLGATCGCDISRLGREICAHLNRPGLPAGGHCRAFDREEIRRLAGDPFWRNSVLAAASLHDPGGPPRCDYENTLRGVAVLGGAILSGQSALEATADLDGVFRVALSHCDRCCPDSQLHLDPAGFSPEGLASVIARRFLHWCAEQGSPLRRTRIPAGPLATIYA